MVWFHINLSICQFADLLIILLPAWVLGKVGVGIDVFLRDGQEQVFLASVSFAYRVQEIECVLTIVPANHIKPAMPFKSEFYTAFVAYFLAHLRLGEVLYI